MCGIAGYIFKDKSKPAELKRIKQMTDIIKYRGPDDEGHYLYGSVALGHRRLSIIDLSIAGHQPMTSIDGRYTLVFNGEIYNYKELATSLEKEGVVFRSKTDTEVLLEAFRVWGIDCVSRFNGMWAFVIYDNLENKVFISRDRFGIKPLYYLNRSDVFAFGSEIKTILAGFPEERKVNEAFVYYFLPSGALNDGPETFFENILEFPPAHSAIYDINEGNLELFRYWDVDVEAFRDKWINDNDPVEVLWDLLNSSVNLHMRADVPVGTCLSGGIDSSTIVGLASRQAQIPMHTFSGLYDDKDCNETQYVDAVNNYLKTIPEPVFPEPNGNLIDDLTRITWHQDEPSAGPGLYTQYHVMKKAGKEVKVLLDGQGGDELFAGYLPYLSLFMEDLLDSGGLVGKAKTAVLIAEVCRYWGANWVSPQVITHMVGDRGLRLIKRLKSWRGKTPDTQPEPAFFHPDFTQRISGKEISRDLSKKLSGKLEDTLYWHLVKQSIPALLRYEDRNSMAFSIEARVPLLDYRIVEFALGLNSSYKIKGSWTKWILRKSCARVAPPEVAWRRSKMGYPTPFARWIRTGSDKEHITEILFSKSFLDRRLVSEETVRFYYDQHMSGKVDRSWLLYRYVTLELWYRMFIDDFDPDMIAN
ncbi:asparagine synthase (glutamine-hydrolyzing) [Desulfosporosinus fructosivorans]